MSVLVWYAVTFGLIGAYAAVVLALKRRGLLERYHLQTYGPFLMWKTAKGRRLLERLSRHRRFWNAYADISIWITVAAMVSMIGLLLWSAVYVLTIRPSGAPDPTYVVGLPGINPVIPLWYGILALAVAIVIHEGAHGILALIGKLKIKSLGLLFFVVPVGAFVEPDEEALKKARPKVRDRMAAVGPATNVLFAVVCALLFSNVFMAALEPEAEGLIITGVVEGSPAEDAHFRSGMVLVSMQLIENGSVIAEVRTLTYDDFKDFLEERAPGETLRLNVLYDGRPESRDAVLADRHEHTGLDEDIGKGYIGIYVLGRSTTELRDMLVDPVADAGGDPAVLRNNMVTYSIVLPFSGLVPFHEPFTEIYEPTGPIGDASEPLFWTLANIFYWLFWLNLMVGISNALPAVPFDGSYLFHDAADGLLARLGLKGEARDRAVGRLLLFVTLAVFFLVIWQVVGPHVGEMFR